MLSYEFFVNLKHQEEPKQWIRDECFAFRTWRGYFVDEKSIVTYVRCAVFGTRDQVAAVQFKLRWSDLILHTNQYYEDP